MQKPWKHKIEGRDVGTQHNAHKESKLDKCITKGPEEKAHYCLKLEKI